MSPGSVPEYSSATWEKSSVALADTALVGGEDRARRILRSGPLGIDRGAVGHQGTGQGLAALSGLAGLHHSVGDDAVQHHQNRHPETEEDGPSVIPDS